MDHLGQAALTPKVLNAYQREKKAIQQDLLDDIIRKRMEKELEKLENIVGGKEIIAKDLAGLEEVETKKIKAKEEKMIMLKQKLNDQRRERYNKQA